MGRVKSPVPTGNIVCCMAVAGIWLNCAGPLVSTRRLPVEKPSRDMYGPEHDRRAQLLSPLVRSWWFNFALGRRKEQVESPLTAR